MHNTIRHALFAAAALASPAFAQAQPSAAPAATFVPASFTPPTHVEAADFQLVPFSPALVKVDFDAYMSSIDHLQKTFSRSTSWPHAGITDADAMKDMEGEQARFKARRAFDYSMLTPRWPARARLGLYHAQPRSRL